MKYTGDSLLGVSFSVKTPKPLDCRTVVDTTQELYTIPTEIAYEGMSVSNLEDGYIYIKLYGACANCLYQDNTINENLLTFFKEEIPDIKGIINVNF